MIVLIVGVYIVSRMIWSRDCSYPAQCKRERKVDKICASQCKRKSIRTNFRRIEVIQHSVNEV